MEPGLHRGDLVLVRYRPEPVVGDVCLDCDPAMGVRVLHRVIRVEDDRLVLQGYVNDFVDDARPRPSEVIGAGPVVLGTARGISAPLGRGKPLHAALLAFVLAVVALTGTIVPRRQAPKEVRSR